MLDSRIEKQRNLSGWSSAEEVLRDFISRHWQPRFIIEGDSEKPYCSTVYFMPLDELYIGLFRIVPLECNQEFLKCFGDANERMISEIGFEVNPWLYNPLSERTLQAMNNELAEKIRRYEYETRNCVKDLFLQMVLYSEWNVDKLELYK